MKVMFAVRDTLTALAAGVRAVITSAVIVVKLQVTAASGLPARSRIALVSLTVYVVPRARLALGFNVTTRVVAL